LSDRYVAAIDQGTASSRCLVFDQQGRIVSLSQKEHEQIFPRPGWVEHDPQEILRNVVEVVRGALDSGGLDARDLVAVGIANQRETTVVWDRHTGQPVHNAIVWQDTRTDSLVRKLGAEHGQDRFRDRCGLPLATYFSGPKVSWLLDSAPDMRKRAEDGELLFGTMDSWLVWNLTGRHVTDVTNASRTMLMNLETLDWDETLLNAIGVPRAMLPAIQPSSSTDDRPVKSSRARTNAELAAAKSGASPRARAAFTLFSALVAASRPSWMVCNAGRYRTRKSTATAIVPNSRTRPTVASTRRGDQPRW